jgi:hypothetical protein
VKGAPHTDEGTDAGTARAVLLVLCGFQLATGLVVLAISPSAQAGAYAFVAGWGWLALAVALVAGPLLFRWRLLRVRARRQRLLQEEWMGRSPGGTMHDNTSGRRRLRK